MLKVWTLRYFSWGCFRVVGVVVDFEGEVDGDKEDGVGVGIRATVVGLVAIRSKSSPLAATIWMSFCPNVGPFLPVRSIVKHPGLADDSLTLVTCRHEKIKDKGEQM